MMHRDGSAITRRLHSLVCPVLGITCDPFSNTSNGKDKDSNSRGDKEFALFAERSGSGCCVLLMGAEGCGKTHTLNRLSAHARTHGVFVVEVNPALLMDGRLQRRLSKLPRRGKSMNVTIADGMRAMTEAQLEEEIDGRSLRESSPSVSPQSFHQIRRGRSASPSQSSRGECVADDSFNISGKHGDIPLCGVTNRALDSARKDSPHSRKPIPREEETDRAEESEAHQPVLVVADELCGLCPVRGTTNMDIAVLSRFLVILRLISTRKRCALVGGVRSINDIHVSMTSMFTDTMIIDPLPDERIETMRLFAAKTGLKAPTGDLIQMMSAMDTAEIKECFRRGQERALQTSQRFSLSHLGAAASSLRALSSHHIHVNASSAVSFADIGGLESVKQHLVDVGNLLRAFEANTCPNEERKRVLLMQKFGISPPKGILLYGPPGTGKTMLARALANQAGFSFLSVDVPSIVKGEVGESERSLRRFFSTARKQSPCILFMDEIDAMFKRRGGSKHNVSLMALMNMLMSEQETATMNSTSNNHRYRNRATVVILAATNCPQVLDSSFLSPTRFSSCLLVPPPDKDARHAVLKRKMAKFRNMCCVTDEEIEEIASKTERFTGADLVQLCDSAELLALNRVLDEGNSDRPLHVVVEMRDMANALQEAQPSVSESALKTITEWHR